MVQKEFYPGDKWVYYKLYVGYGSSNQILLDYVKPFTDSLLQQGVIDRWFFIRYKDADPHIRLRFHITSKKHFSALASQFQELIQKAGNDTVRKIEIATYTRELERYGSTTIEETEIFFYHDSELMLSWLSHNPSDELSFLFVLKLIDFRLNCLNFTQNEKIEFFKRLQLSFKHEFHYDKLMLQSLSKKYRALYPEIDKVLNLSENENALLHKLLSKDRVYSLSLMDKILTKKKNVLKEPDINDYMASLFHMSLNRLFRSKQRVYEMLAYDFLYRYSHSKMVRNNTD